MKTGILTFHRAANYGAVLQCYALQEFLKELGHEAYVLDYRQPFIEEHYRRLDLKMFLANLVCLNLKGIWNCVFKRNKELGLYALFRDRFLNIDSKPFNDKNGIPTDYDVYVVGSDQVWNPSMCEGKIDEIYWGKFRTSVSGKIISYAASTTGKGLNSIGVQALKELLLNFNKISIREKDYKDYLEKAVQTPIFINADPTLLVDAKKWSELCKHSKFFDKKGYILLYYVRTCPNNRRMMDEKADLLSCKTGLPVFKIGPNSLCSPEDFVCLIKNASYVVTSSFHGTAFSVIFKKVFWSFLYNDSNDNRYVSLLKTIGLEKQLVDADYSFQNLIVDYNDNVEKKIESIKKEATEYFNGI